MSSWCVVWASIAEIGLRPRDLHQGLAVIYVLQTRICAGVLAPAWARLAGANVTAYFLCGCPGRCGVDRVIVRAPAAAFGDGNLRPGPMNIGSGSGLSSARVVLGTQCATCHRDGPS